MDEKILSEADNPVSERATDDVAWAGPGTHETDRRMRHNRELISRVLGDNLSSPRAYALFVGGDYSKVAGKKAIEKLSLYDDEYYRKAALLNDAVENAFKSMRPYDPESCNCLLAVANNIEAFVIDVEQLLDRLNLTGKFIIPGYLAGTVVYQAMLLAQYAENMLKVDGDESHEVSRRCIEVSTFSLQLIEFQASRHDNTDTVSRVILLVTRGRCKKRLGEYREALADFRATRAFIALSGPEWKRNPTLSEVTVEILKVLALMKIGSPRPHFSEEKLEKWQKELGLSVFSHDKYKCSYCGVAKTDNQNLMQCSRCNYRWYCGAECQRAAWTETHKRECKVLRSMTSKGPVVDPEVYDSLMTCIENGGYDDGYTLLGSGDHFGRIFMKDPDTGELFDSLTNEVLTRFCPEEDKKCRP